VNLSVKNESEIKHANANFVTGADGISPLACCFVVVIQLQHIKIELYEGDQPRSDYLKKKLIRIKT
jgi:hypothetical protein